MKYIILFLSFFFSLKGYTQRRRDTSRDTTVTTRVTIIMPYPPWIVIPGYGMWRITYFDAQHTDEHMYWLEKLYDTDLKEVPFGNEKRMVQEHLVLIGWHKELINSK